MAALSYDAARPYDALVLSGGRARRLGGASKPELEIAGEQLIVTALRAASGARTTVVVGPQTPHHALELTTREEPQGGGPVAAIAAGIALLPDGAQWVLVLACDTPRAAHAVPVLLAAASEGASAAAEVVIGVEGGHRQPLLALYERRALGRALGDMDVNSASMRSLLERLTVVEAALPEGTSRDLDTWEDVEQARRELT